MSAPSDGGPAFPIFSDCAQAPGMTLRDYFAVAALQGLLSSDFPDGEDMEPFVIDAYGFADAMLAERTKPTETWSNSGLTESEELLQKTQQLENEIAALRAENKRLVDAIRAVIQAASDHANKGVQP